MYTFTIHLQYSYNTFTIHLHTCKIYQNIKLAHGCYKIMPFRGRQGAGQLRTGLALGHGQDGHLDQGQLRAARHRGDAGAAGEEAPDRSGDLASDGAAKYDDFGMKYGRVGIYKLIRVCRCFYRGSNLSRDLPHKLDEARLFPDRQCK